MAKQRVIGWTNGIWCFELYTSYPMSTMTREVRPLVKWWELDYSLLSFHQALKQSSLAECLRKTEYEIPDVLVGNCIELGHRLYYEDGSFLLR